MGYVVGDHAMYAMRCDGSRSTWDMARCGRRPLSTRRLDPMYDVWMTADVPPAVETFLGKPIEAFQVMWRFSSRAVLR